MFFDPAVTPSRSWTHLLSIYHLLPVFISHPNQPGITSIPLHPHGTPLPKSHPGSIQLHSLQTQGAELCQGKPHNSAYWCHKSSTPPSSPLCFSNPLCFPNDLSPVLCSSYFTPSPPSSNFWPQQFSLTSLSWVEPFQFHKINRNHQ